MKEYIIKETLERMERRAEIASKHVSEDNDPEKAEGWKRAMKHYMCAAEALKEIKQYHAIGTIKECREMKERQIGKKLKKSGMSTICTETTIIF